MIKVSPNNSSSVSTCGFCRYNSPRLIENIKLHRYFEEILIPESEQALVLDSEPALVLDSELIPALNLVVLYHVLLSLGS